MGNSIEKALQKQQEAAAKRKAEQAQAAEQPEAGADTAVVVGV